MQLPKDFETYTRALMGHDLYATLQEGLGREAPVSIRLNPFKETDSTGRPAADKVCRASGEVEWCAEGVFLESRPNFTFDPLLHAGRYYVQEASSMFVSHILRQLVSRPVLMLDLCAAPGGKSTAVRSVLPEGSLLFSNEPVKQRASVLAENIQKFGHPDVIVTNNFPKDYGRSELTFDVVLADVPCSGEGMFRKDEAAIGEWSTQNVENCQRLQRTIIEEIWPRLREGGLLIYSTCTFNAHEDEENANWIAEHLGADFVEIDTVPAWNITGSLTDENHIYRFIPGKTRGEGLFIAVLRKHGESAEALSVQQEKGIKEQRKARKDKRSNTTDRTPHAMVANWLHGDFCTKEVRESIVGIPAAWLPIYEKAVKSLHVIHAGVTLGTVKGRDIIPDVSLALSVCLRSDAFPAIAADYSTAISFLRKEAIMLPAQTPKGFVLLTYQGSPLGFVKNIGTRANNLYPQEWKIKSTHTPQQPVMVIKTHTSA